jgi:hypothetical protein
MPFWEAALWAVATATVVGAERDAGERIRCRATTEILARDRHVLPRRCYEVRRRIPRGD